MSSLVPDQEFRDELADVLRRCGPKLAKSWSRYPSLQPVDFEDLLETTFLNILRRFDGQEDRPRGRPLDRYFTAAALNLGRSLVRDRLKKDPLYSIFERPLEEMAADSGTESEPGADTTRQRTTRRMVREVLNAFDDDDRLILKHTLDEFAHGESDQPLSRELCPILEISPGALRVRKHRLIGQFRVRCQEWLRLHGGEAEQ